MNSAPSRYEVPRGAIVKPYSLAEARYILSHVYCVDHAPDDGGLLFPYANGMGEAICARCSCRNPADLRLYVASVARAAAWLEIENTAILDQTAATVLD